MKKLWAEFKAFAFKGSMLDMAVAVLMATAFGEVINGVIDCFLTPILDWVFNFVKMIQTHSFHLPLCQPAVFIGCIVKFLVYALVIFIIVKAVNKAIALGKKPEIPGAPTTRECPFCYGECNIKATKCCHCGSDLPKIEYPTDKAE